MPRKDVIIVFDCGATNVRAVAINGKGEILTSESYRNNTQSGSLPSLLQDLGCK